MENKSALAIVQETTNALDVFCCGKVDKLIEDIEREVKSIVPDLTTAGGRKEIASLAHKVSRSKTALDGLGKDLVSDWKAKSKAVDEERKLVRDRLDALRDEVRRPLTEWEEAEKAKEEKAALDKQIAEAYELALVENELFDLRKKEEERKERERIAEEERLAKIAEEEAEKARLAREEEIRKEAEKKAMEEAALMAAKEKEEAERRIIEARLAEEKAKRDAEEALRLAEEKRLKDLREQEERRNREEAEREAEKARIAAAEAAEAERKAANKKHQANINRGILECIVALGITEDIGKQLISQIARNEIPNLKIMY